MTADEYNKLSPKEEEHYFQCQKCSTGGAKYECVPSTLTGRKIFERFRTTATPIVMLNPLRTVMGEGRTNRTRSRNAKSRRRRRSSAKLSGKLRPLVISNEETTDVEHTPSLLVSSLRYWEVERDLIDERLVAIRERQQRRLFGARNHA